MRKRKLVLNPLPFQNVLKSGQYSATLLGNETAAIRDVIFSPPRAPTDTNLASRWVRGHSCGSLAATSSSTPRRSAGCLRQTKPYEAQEQIHSPGKSRTNLLGFLDLAGPASHTQPPRGILAGTGAAPRPGRWRLRAALWAASEHPAARREQPSAGRTQEGGPGTPAGAELGARRGVSRAALGSSSGSGGGVMKSSAPG